METKPPTPRAVRVGIQTAEVDDAAHTASPEDLGRLVRTLGYEVVGSVPHRRQQTGAASLLGSGDLTERAAIPASGSAVPVIAACACASRHGAIRQCRVRPVAAPEARAKW